VISGGGYISSSSAVISPSFARVRISSCPAGSRLRALGPCWPRFRKTRRHSSSLGGGLGGSRRRRAGCHPTPGNSKKTPGMQARTVANPWYDDADSASFPLEPDAVHVLEI
jgi:hypothetical protein